MYNLNTSHCYPVEAKNLKYCGRASFCMFYSPNGKSCCGNCSLGSLEKCREANLTQFQDEL